MMYYYQRLKDLREDAGNTQKEVADLLKISQSYISRIEKKVLLRLRDEMAAF